MFNLNENNQFFISNAPTDMRVGVNAMCVKAFVFRFVSVPAKWVRTARQHVLNIYSENKAYAKVFLNDFG